MPSPFPGMDPFIEAQAWGGFHHYLIGELGKTLVKMLRPRYLVAPEERIYVETSEPDTPFFRADVAVVRGDRGSGTQRPGANRLEIEPSIYTLPLPVEEREPFLVIRKTETREVIAVIELLSPTNKRQGSDGRQEYLSKRLEILRTPAHLVEIDLLLGGRRLPTDRPLKPATDYCVFVSRRDQRPRVGVFEWSLSHRLPHIPIPLSNGDSDAIVDLQAAFDAVYDEGGFDYALQYDCPLDVPLNTENAGWVAQVLAARKSG
jgi:hypothetical protein